MGKAKESEEMYKLLLDATGDMILTAEPQTGEILYCNEKFTELLGIPASELVGKSIYKIFPDDQRERYEKLLSGSGKKHIVDDVFVAHREGRLISVEIKTKTVEMEGKTVLCVILRDITARKTLDAQLKRNCQLQTIISSVLQVSTKPIPLRKQLDLILSLILSYKWFDFQAKGSIHVVEASRPEVLVLYAQKNFEPIQLKLCNVVPVGKCLCGMAAATHKTVFADKIDARHEHQYEAMAPHGHYCIPIML
ncbi:MAG: PAS domain S-box protein, partial [Candidatus Magnetominusculus sp. LBB02]|nr:PAS domain S-box protein [Candidatus Magnetominusculus sp. LBB02]